MILGSLDSSRRAARFDYKLVKIGDRLVTQIAVRGFQQCFGWLWPLLERRSKRKKNHVESLSVASRELATELLGHPMNLASEKNRVGHPLDIIIDMDIDTAAVASLFTLWILFHEHERRTINLLVMMYIAVIIDIMHLLSNGMHRNYYRRPMITILLVTVDVDIILQTDDGGRVLGGSKRKKIVLGYSDTFYPHKFMLGDNDDIFEMCAKGLTGWLTITGPNWFPDLNLNSLVNQGFMKVYKSE
ncbi:hypothetical protein IEQ34_018652 [Dendrobium chrysotoxum]|uniref:Uncharacterized protein n=1 Tax=Dendrobium chrysotoxum TaxID=161865 RepID=A0AAV7G7L8_DENCH|nr:hypothetical protein IEQ34_018652 [Dendrobium chrysotoxum]